LPQGPYVEQESAMLDDPTRGRPVLPLTEQIYASLKNEILDGLWVGRVTFSKKQPN